MANSSGARLRRDTSSFGQTAALLARAPLGIIALFIVLIHSVATLLLAFGVPLHLEPRDRSALVLFLVLFPVVVLGVFAWLVAGKKRYLHLYSPDAYPDRETFIATLFYGQAAMDRQKLPAPPTHSHALDPTATANLYWLGHDLMWSADTLLRQGPTANVLIGLDQALHHLHQIGLADSGMGSDLQSLRLHIKGTRDLTWEMRDAAADTLGQVIDRIGAQLEAAQPGFVVPPHWKRSRNAKGGAGAN